MLSIVDAHQKRLLYLRTQQQRTIAMSDHHAEGHFPEEAEQNEIVGPVLLALLCFGAIILLIWAMS